MKPATTKTINFYIEPLIRIWMLSPHSMRV